MKCSRYKEKKKNKKNELDYILFIISVRFSIA